MIGGKTFAAQIRGYICPTPGLPIERQRQMATDAACLHVYEHRRPKDGEPLQLDRWMQSLRAGDTAWLPSVLCLVVPVRDRPKGYRPLAGVSTALNRILATGAIVVDARAGVTSQCPEAWANHVGLSSSKVSAGTRTTTSRRISQRGVVGAVQPGIKSRWHAPAMAQKLALQKTIWTGAGTIEEVREHLDDELRRCSGRTLYGVLGVRRPNDPKSGGRPSDNARPKVHRVRYVYFIQRGRAREVKIGSAYDVTSRFNSLKTSSPDDLRLIASIAGNESTERELHKRFEDYWIRREWFRLDGALAEFIRQLPKPKTR